MFFKRVENHLLKSSFAYFAWKETRELVPVWDAFSNCSVSELGINHVFVSYFNPLRSSATADRGDQS